MKFNNSVIMTISGIGYTNGGMILGGIGDIHRFSIPSRLLAFDGLDHTVYHSGKTIPQNALECLNGAHGCSDTHS